MTQLLHFVQEAGVWAPRVNQFAEKDGLAAWRVPVMRYMMGPVTSGTLAVVARVG